MNEVGLISGFLISKHLVHVRYERLEQDKQALFIQLHALTTNFHECQD